MTAPYSPGAPGPYPAAPQPVLPAYQGPKPSGLGITALVLVLVAIVGSAVCSWAIGSMFGQVVREGGGTSAAVPENEFGMRFGWLIAAQVLWALLGLAALVIGIIAAAGGRGRAQGVIAIVLSILGPGIGFMVFFAVVNATAEYAQSIGT